ncbi:MAG: YHS domain-containing protein [Gemmatimonadota bacterium]|nr:YHS domain-containing protein [Gemmatimonadota bacterium]
MQMGGGGDAPSGPSGQAESSAVDPVCGMPVPADQGYAEVYQGRLLRFCSRRCLDAFDVAPHRYAG